MSDTVERMPLAELELTQEYQRLTPKQKLWVSTYCASGILDGVYDSVAATNVAYRCKSMEVARIMSYSLMQNIRIVAVLNRHFNTTPIEAFLVQVDRAILNKNLSTSQLGALKSRLIFLDMPLDSQVLTDREWELFHLMFWKPKRRNANGPANPTPW